MRRIEGVKRWDTAGVKRQEHPNDEEFDIFQAEYIDQLDSRLVWLRPREDGYRGNVRTVRFRP